MKILIADDDSSNRKHLRAPLVSRGIQPNPLVELPRASRCYTHSPIDSNIDSSDDQSRAMHPALAIMDISMPKLA